MQIVSCHARVPFYYDPSTFQIILCAAIIEEMYKALLQTCTLAHTLLPIFGIVVSQWIILIKFTLKKSRGPYPVTTYLN